jgi:hypothetical protein
MNVLNGSYLWTFVILFIPLCGGYFFLWIPAESEEKGKELALKYSLQNVVDKNQEEHIEEEVQ